MTTPEREIGAARVEWRPQWPCPFDMARRACAHEHYFTGGPADGQWFYTADNECVKMIGDRNRPGRVAVYDRVAFMNPITGHVVSIFVARNP